MSDFYRRPGKRVFDLVLTLPALVVLTPVMGAVALAVRLRLGAPVLFQQERPGLGGEPFTIYKFRTMTDDRDEHGTLLPDAERLTGLGRFLRSTSLDELPELFNVLKGDMTLVGPRPLRMRYLDLYTVTEARRHEVRPGITGWAQVQGRNLVTWDERLQMDVWYVDNRCIYLDLRILWLTVRAILTRQGISSPGHATMPGLDAGRGKQRLAERE